MYWSHPLKITKLRKFLFTLPHFLLFSVFPSIAWAQNWDGFGSILTGYVANILGFFGLIFLSHYYYNKFKNPSYDGLSLILLLVNYVLYILLTIIYIVVYLDYSGESLFAYFCNGFLYIILIISHIVCHIIYKSKSAHNNTLD